MESLDFSDRESRFQDVCRFAAAVVVVGLIVVASEASMHRALDYAPVSSNVVKVAPNEYFPSQFTLDALEPESHIEAF